MRETPRSLVNIMKLENATTLEMTHPMTVEVTIRLSVTLRTQAHEASLIVPNAGGLRELRSSTKSSQDWNQDKNSSEETESGILVLISARIQRSSPVVQSMPARVSSLSESLWNKTASSANRSCVTGRLAPKLAWTQLWNSSRKQEDSTFTVAKLITLALNMSLQVSKPKACADSVMAMYSKTGSSLESMP